jgi:hypothetical protein
VRWPRGCTTSATRPWGRSPHSPMAKALCIACRHPIATNRAEEPMARLGEPQRYVRPSLSLFRVCMRCSRNGCHHLLVHRGMPPTSLFGHQQHAVKLTMTLQCYRAPLHTLRRTTGERSFSCCAASMALF